MGDIRVRDDLNRVSGRIRAIVALTIDGYTQEVRIVLLGPPSQVSIPAQRVLGRTEISMVAFYARHLARHAQFMLRQGARRPRSVQSYGRHPWV